MLVFIEDWIPQRHCRYPIVFLSRWRASTVVIPGRTPRDENWSPHWPVTKLSWEKINGKMSVHHVISYTKRKVKKKGGGGMFSFSLHCSTYKRGVRFRNIFIPNRGPWVSPAPISTCVATDNLTLHYVFIRKAHLDICFEKSWIRRECCAIMWCAAYLPPPLC